MAPRTGSQISALPLASGGDDQGYPHIKCRRSSAGWFHIQGFSKPHGIRVAAHLEVTRLLLFCEFQEACCFPVNSQARELTPETKHPKSLRGGLHGDERSLSYSCGIEVWCRGPAPRVPRSTVDPKKRCCLGQSGEPGREFTSPRMPRTEGPKHLCISICCRCQTMQTCPFSAPRMRVTYRFVQVSFASRGNLPRRTAVSSFLHRLAVGGPSVASSTMKAGNGCVMLAMILFTMMVMVVLMMLETTMKSTMIVHAGGVYGR